MNEREPALAKLADDVCPGVEGECAALVRMHDWAKTPLGPTERWPQPLRTLVALILASKQPMFVCWGRDGTLIYNDAYAEILAAKHPRAMGTPFLDAWDEIRDSLVPLVDRVMSGEPVFMDDIALDMRRRDYAEKTHFSFSYTPVRDEACRIAGFYCACDEITDQVELKKFAALRAEMLEQLRGLNDPKAILVRACEILGPPLEADAVAFAEIDEAQGRVRIEGSWSLADLRGLDGHHPLGDLGAGLVEAAFGHAPLAIPDAGTDDRAAGLAGPFAPFAAGGLLAAPLQRAGLPSLVLLVMSRTPRRWSEVEIEFALQKVERLSPLLERARADQALREERTFLKAVIETAPIGISIARDPLGLPPILNQAARDMTGLRDLSVGERRYDLFTAVTLDGEPYAVDDYPTIRALKKGEEITEEPMIYVQGGKKRRWLVNSRPIVGENGDISAAVTAFVDVEQQLRSEERVRLINRELNHRVKNLFAVVQSLVSLSARDETDADELATKLSGRISALAAAHSVGMSDEPGNKVLFSDMLSAILSPYGRTEPYLTVEGPDILLPSHMVTPLGLILHELATNAVKYGAWSNADGHLSVAWAFEDDETVVLSWHERCEDPRGCLDHELGSGFGTQLMEGAARQVGGRVEQEWGEEGLHTTVSMKIDQS